MQSSGLTAHFCRHPASTTSKLTQIHCYYKFELSHYSKMEDVQISLNLCLIPTSSAARGGHRYLLVVRRKPEKSIEPKSSREVPQHPIREISPTLVLVVHW